VDCDHWEFHSLRARCGWRQLYGAGFGLGDWRKRKRKRKRKGDQCGCEYVVSIFHVCFSFFVLAFGELSSLRTHFRPFTEVMRKSRREVTQEVRFARLNR
jgi:hypothetical protein